MSVDIKVIGEFPDADFAKGRRNALDKVGVVGVQAAKAAAPIQRSRRGGHAPGTLRDAITKRNLQGGTAVKIGVIGAKSPGFFGRFVENGHKIVVGRVNAWQRRTAKGGSPMALKVRLNAKTGRGSAWKKDRSGMRTIGTVPAHPFFFPAMARLAPSYGDTVIDELEKSVVMEKVRL